MTPVPPNKHTDSQLDICLKVEIMYADGQRELFCTRHISTTGLVLENGARPAPVPGTLLHVRISPQMGMKDAPLVAAEVTERDANGFSIRFLTT